MKVLAILIAFLPADLNQNPLPDSLQSFLQQEPKDTAYISSLNRLAFNCLKSNPTHGRMLAVRSAEVASQINFQPGLARALDITGSSYWVVGDYESALKYYQLSATQSREINDRMGLSSVYHNIGEVFKKLGDYPKSLKFLKESLDLDAGNDYSRGITLYNIGEAYLLSHQFDSARGYFEQAMVLGLSSKSDRVMAYCYHGLGTLEFENAHFKEALDYFTKAEKLWTKEGDTRSLIQTYIDFAKVYIELKHLQTAMENLNKAVQLATKIAAPDLQIVNYQKISEVLALQGNHRKALELMQKHLALKDSVYNLKKTETIQRLQAEFEAAEKEAENQQLKAEQQLKNSLIESQQKLIWATVIGLILAGLLVWFLFRQRKKISEVNQILSTKTVEIHQQKQEIELQAEVLQKLNEELQSLNKNLEQRIQERTNQLVIQNQKLAAYAHANAHQLRAPVASVLGLLTLLERIDLTEEDKELISYLMKCGAELDRITKEISRQLEAELPASKSIVDTKLS